MATSTAAAELRFRAMGCDVHILVVDGRRQLLRLARDRVEELSGAGAGSGPAARSAG